MITLYGSGRTRSFRALWALEEAELEYEFVSVKIGSPEEGGTQTSSYKKMNFQGKIPTLVNEGNVINESGAIINYIAALVPHLKLMPTDSPITRAYYDEVCYFVLTDLEQPLWTYGKHTFVMPEKQRVSAVLPVTHWEFNKSIKALNHYIQDKEFIIGNNFTMADILISHTLNWAEAFKFKVPENLLAYKSRMYARPSCLKALDKTEKE